jgi:hypothetical protein
MSGFGDSACGQSGEKSVTGLCDPIIPSGVKPVVVKNHKPISFQLRPILLNIRTHSVFPMITVNVDPVKGVVLKQMCCFLRGKS